MVTTPTNPQRLSTRDDDNGQPGWGPMQIATPAIVGGVLLIILAAYIVWHRLRPGRKHPYNYHPVRTAWITKIEHMLVPKRMRTRVLHSSAPMTIDESMRMTAISLDFRRPRQCRSDSSDSRTPLTETRYAFDYPPNPKLSDSPPPIPKRRLLRWWWLFGSRPQEIKSQEPGSRWRVDGPDGSSSGHGNSSHGHEEYRPRYIGGLETTPEDLDEPEGDVIPIGENFTSIASTPLTQRFPEQAQAICGASTIPDHPGSSVTRTPVPVVNTPRQSNPGTPVPLANRGLPPSYDVSQNHTLVHYPSAEEIVRVARSQSYLPLVVPPPSRTAAYLSSPRGFHGRELSSESFLSAQPPMAVPTSIY